MLTPAHWIAPDGEKIDVKRSHIATVISRPHRFGVTLDWLKSVYRCQGEDQRFGCEGKAREDIIRFLVMDNWIRTRRYIKPATYWSITARELDFSACSRLLEWMIGELQGTHMTQATEIRLSLLDPGKMVIKEVTEMRSLLEENMPSADWPTG